MPETEAPVPSDAVVDVGVEVDAGDGLEVVGDLFGDFLAPQPGDEVGEFAFEFGGVVAFRQEEVGVVFEAGFRGLPRFPDALDDFVGGDRCGQEAEAEMGVSGDIFQDAGDGELASHFGVFDGDDFSDWIFTAEEFFCHLLGEEDGVRFLEGGFGVALDEGEGEEFQDVCVGHAEPLAEAFVAVAYPGPAVLSEVDPHGALDFREVVFERGGEGARGANGVAGIGAFGVGFSEDPVDPVGVFVVPVVAEFILDVEEDEDAAGHADGQAGDVDEGIDFVAEEVAEGDGEVVFEHGGSPGGGLVGNGDLMWSVAS